MPLSEFKDGKELILAIYDSLVGAFCPCLGFLTHRADLHNSSLPRA